MSRTDEEEVELLKNLWQEYGKPVVTGVAITVVAIFGYKAYQKNQLETAAASSQLYQSLLEVTTQGQPLSEQQKSTVKHVVETLQSDYENSDYAAFATLFQAREQVLDNDLDGARSSLEWVLAQKPDLEVELVTRARLARVMLSQSDDNAQAALDVLAKADSEAGFVATIESVRGDAHLAMGQRDRARESYEKALEAARTNGESRPLLQFKLDDLAANVKEG
ncbi:YfgM family protein [Endozoicomonas sp. 8E]|uniref:YfgM family protein n=1 Tax=Endozoicomonas sp. 8E TaxID=3035692 RepID=UPI00293950DA|nr:tetratricopeptide repeat protein [Endozoicomonas sp. 8E]WOG25848.1 tetratricopeptide repeat protein [Endozoicomonas sp. 8E]